MNYDSAVTSFSALAQPTRLTVLRLLAVDISRGMSAGELATHLHVVPSTLSHHLGRLEAAGLVSGHRNGRQTNYRVEPQAVRLLVGLLLEECGGS